MKTFSFSCALGFNSPMEISGLKTASILQKSIPVVFAFLITGCAHTEKYLHPEKTFSLDNLPLSSLTQEVDNPRKVADLELYETCADIASVHSPIIWVPLIGPAIDVSMSSKNIGTTSSRWDNAIIFVPLLGPAISFSATSPETCTYKTFHQSTTAINPDIAVKPDTVTYVANIADQNCAIFLDRLSSSKESLNFTTKALSDTATATAAGTAFVSPLGAAVVSTVSLLTNKGAENLAHSYFGGQLIPAIKNNIMAERTQYRRDNIENNQPDTMAKLIHVFDGYDKTCSVQNAIDNLNNPNKK